MSGDLFFCRQIALRRSLKAVCRTVGYKIPHNLSSFLPARSLILVLALASPRLVAHLLRVCAPSLFPVATLLFAHSSSWWQPSGNRGRFSLYPHVACRTWDVDLDNLCYTAPVPPPLRQHPDRSILHRSPAVAGPRCLSKSCLTRRWPTLSTLRSCPNSSRSAGVPETAATPPCANTSSSCWSTARHRNRLPSSYHATSSTWPPTTPASPTSRGALRACREAQREDQWRRRGLGSVAGRLYHDG